MELWRRLLLISWLLLVATIAPAWGISNQTSGTITANGGIVSLPTYDAANTTVVITGTFTGTLQFECFLDATTSWFSCQATAVTGGSAVTSTTTTGAWKISTAATQLRVRASSAITGTATVSLYTTSSSTGGGGGGVASLNGPVGAADYILSVSGGTTSAYNTKTNVVDFSGTDAGAVLNSVMGALTSGGLIVALEGTYTVTSPIFYATGVALRCASWATNFAEQGGMAAASAIFQLGSASGGAAVTDTELSGCKVTGRQSDTTEHIFGVAANASSGTPARIRIAQNWINNTSDTGIKFGTAINDLTITNNFLDTIGNSNASATGHGIGCVSGSANGLRITIAGNSIYNTFRGGIHCLNNTFVAMLTITGNTIYHFATGAQDGAIFLDSVGGLGGPTISGNTIVEGVGTTVYGIYFNGGSYATISGNMINEGELASVFINSTAAHVVVTGNTILNAGQTGDGIVVAGSDVVVSGNEISGNTRDGVRIAATAVRAVVSGNHIRNNTTTGVNILAGAVDYLVASNTFSANGTNITNASVSNGTVGCNYFAGGSTVTCGLGNGTGTGTPVYLANVQTSTTGVGNGADTTDDTLFTYSLPLNSMSVNGKGVHVRGWGTTAANANTKRVKLFFAGTAIADSNATAFNATPWSIEYTCTRNDATHVGCVGTWNDNGLATADVTVQLNLVVSDLTANASVIKLTGASTVTGAANDVLGYGMKVFFEN